jgi:hypothetical protein
VPKHRVTPQQSRPSTRNIWQKFRVSLEEQNYIKQLAEKAGFRNVSNYLRAMLGLPAIRRGAPAGNQNKKGKSGGNVYTRKR